ncbi:DASH complex subunit Duo1 [Colletotrichum paranaense]|uniref:DASH complex subunit DUO1 n=8 Tax=Colletotrichum acutatum species complex TaxID=2707335 RepID=A0A9P7U9E3_9PEZI|nr:DASH complex subunit Duo1 [Colletotrichum scovillei]XP_060343672.1 DASH complex subunit Duo1 [Colletotrichum paranaense]XP_060384326.1 DASH complex subunit Duo1 [Colletotrichum tamarilloi]XP_060401813.1 DASH complex subunit Duo1 [Colletotrichum abscissum]KAK0377386.1 DASH complex subunit Duo1 [Colletotrichum limetticola]KAK1495138.1 DASH complex subunit Duo1 [Colletotrichum cuscutae]KAK1713550.1 DASH complex subunit Duo1-domain-containing protein [Colletotrichum lupini]KXH58073.1 DASH com
MADYTDDSITEDIWASPGPEGRGAPPSERPETPRTPKTPKTPKTPANQTHNAPYDREASLRKELEGVRNINAAIEGIISTLDKAKGNMNTVGSTVSNASTLLNTWTRILSQTEHNQRLILNPNWQGASNDLVQLEAETLQKQQLAERRAAEEERRREAARRKREEEDEERQRQAAVGSAPRGRGVSRGRVRGTSSATRGHSYSSSTSRIGRGAASVRGGYRGRARGTE